MKDLGKKFLGDIYVHRGVKPPWLELTFVNKKTGKTTKIIGRPVDKFLSEEWSQTEEEVLS